MRYLILLLLPLRLFAQTPAEVQRWEKQATQVTIYRDNWGIPHIYGQKDADAVFGLLYAQCEDDFPRVEMNYIEKLGRMSEVKGASERYNDLLIRMVIDQEAAKKEFTTAPAWLKKLCEAFADGINYYLYKHPEKKPALLTHFEPWYPLLWTDGSIGAINTADMTTLDLKNFYGQASPPAPGSMGNSFQPQPALNNDEGLTGSNGFAIAPKMSASGNAMLYINPHVTFYFRPEVHMSSGEGLNVYGAVTWGQFFIYQGFNAHCGWMHTSSAVDAADTYAEKVTFDNGRWLYTYNGKTFPFQTKAVTLRLKKADGSFDTETITVYASGHGPVMGMRDGKWVTVRADNRIMNGLIQCWQRNKANSFAAFKKTLDLFGNISNNTVYADAEGNIAYWHGNRIPKRDPKYNWNRVVDGSVSATNWKGIHPIREIVQSINPANGWLQNCNSTPFTVAGANSPKKENYPFYMAPDGENFRGVNAVRVLAEEKNYTIDKLIAAGYDTRLSAFEVLIPALVKAFDRSVKPGDTLYDLIADPMLQLKIWDFRCNEESVATTLAIEWGQKLLPLIAKSGDQDEFEFVDQVTKTNRFAATASDDLLLRLFAETIREMKTKYGGWKIAWGAVNRFQRISPEIDNRFDDRQPSIPVGFASSAWGMLPSYTSRTFPGTVKRYGVNGNSFICAVEFGKKVKAKSLLAGGESGDPGSPHYFDQALMYSKGQFKDVYFYKEDVLQHAVRTYHPGN